MNMNTLAADFRLMPPPLDYLDHPAFKSISLRVGQWDEKKVAALIVRIDQTYLSIDQKTFHNKQLFLAQIEKELLPAIDTLGEYLLSRMDGEANRFWIQKSICGTYEVLRENLIYSHKCKYYVSNPRACKYAEKIEQLKTNGFALFPYPQELKDQLIEGCKPYVADLRRRLDARPGVRAAVSIPFKGVFGKAINKIVDDYGVVLAASEYRKHKMDLLYAALEVSRPTHRWYKDCYQDVGLPTSKTVTMHYDYESTMMKAMIYLVPVTEINGATGIVPGSHLWKRSPFLFAFLNDLDNKYPQAYPNRHNEDDYYRPRFKYFDERERFANLPKILQATSHFGDDVIDGSPLSEFLLKSEKRFVSDAPECMLFDGPQVIHRGGMVVEGERIALQLAFRLREDFSSLKKIGRRVKTVATRLIGAQQ